MPDLIRTFVERGDLAHLALVLWAGSATVLLYLTLRALIAATRRFDDFVRELARTLKRRGLRRIPMLFQHDPAEPVGVCPELIEDARGLRARGRLIPDVARARELIALVRAGAVDGLSIGFRTVKGRVDPASR